MSTFTFQVLTPDGEVFSKEGITFSKLSSSLGELGVMPEHSHTVSDMVPGEVILKKDEEESYFFVSEGIVHVTPTKVTLFSSYIESVDEIDVTRAEKAKDRAMKRLSSNDSEIDKERARKALMRAEKRLSVVASQKEN